MRCLNRWHYINYSAASTTNRGNSCKTGGLSPDWGDRIIATHLTSTQTGPMSQQQPHFPTPHGYAPPPKPSSAKPVIVIVVVAAVGVFMVVCVLLGFALLFPAVMAARQAAKQQHSRERLHQIAIALHNYHDTYMRFPPSYIHDKNGIPRTSWRAMILPFMEERPLHERYNFNVPWDDEANADVRAVKVLGYQSPVGEEAGTNRTRYVVVTSKIGRQSPPITLNVQEGKAPLEIRFPTRTIFPEGEAARLSDIKDGTSNTIAVVEIQDSDIEWAEPRDIDIDSLSTRPGSPNWVDLQGGAVVAFADASARVLPRGISLDDFKKLLSRDGAENPPQF
jgi:hypothetical protein